MSAISALTNTISSPGSAINRALSQLTSGTASGTSTAQSAAAATTSSTSSSPPTSSSSGSSSSTSTAQSSDPLGSESTFLTLLVSQLQNQDPLNPTDSNQFVSQLVSYSQLEQLINIDQNTTGLSGAAAAAAGSTPVSTTTGSSTGSQTTGASGI